MLNKFHNILTEQQYLILSFVTLCTSFLFGLAAALILDLKLPYDNVAHLFIIKALASGAISILSLGNYFWGDHPNA